MAKFLSGSDFLYIGLAGAAVYAAYRLTKPATDIVSTTGKDVGVLTGQITDVTGSTASLLTTFLDQIKNGFNQSAATQASFLAGIKNYFDNTSTAASDVSKDVLTQVQKNIDSVAGVQNTFVDSVNKIVGNIGNTISGIISYTPTSPNITNSLPPSTNPSQNVNSYFNTALTIPEQSSVFRQPATSSTTTINTKPPVVTTRVVQHTDAQGKPYTITYTI